MKKIIILLSILFFSCNNDDEIESPIHNPTFNVDLVLKRWKFDQINVNGVQYLYQHQQNCNKDEFTFANQEGQIRQYNELIFVNENCSTNSINMEWKIKNDIISLFFGSQKIIDYKVISVTHNSFVYSFNYDIDNDTIEDHIIMFSVPYE